MACSAAGCSGQFGDTLPLLILRSRSVPQFLHPSQYKPVSNTRHCMLWLSYYVQWTQSTTTHGVRSPHKVANPTQTLPCAPHHPLAMRTASSTSFSCIKAGCSKHLQDAALQQLYECNRPRLVVLSQLQLLVAQAKPHWGPLLIVHADATTFKLPQLRLLLLQHPAPRRRCILCVAAG